MKFVERRSRKTNYFRFETQKKNALILSKARSNKTTLFYCANLVSFHSVIFRYGWEILKTFLGEQNITNISTNQGATFLISYF